MKLYCKKTKFAVPENKNVFIKGCYYETKTRYLKEINVIDNTNAGWKLAPLKEEFFYTIPELRKLKLNEIFSK